MLASHSINISCFRLDAMMWDYDEIKEQKFKMYLHDLCMSNVQFWKLHLKCSYFFLYQQGLCSIHGWGIKEAFCHNNMLAVAF